MTDRGITYACWLSGAGVEAKTQQRYHYEGNRILERLVGL
jgi:hypothetical protein